MTNTPEGAVCGTPAWLANGPILPVNPTPIPSFRPASPPIPDSMGFAQHSSDHQGRAPTMTNTQVIVRGTPTRLASGPISPVGHSAS